MKRAAIVVVSGLILLALALAVIAFSTLDGGYHQPITTDRAHDEPVFGLRGYWRCERSLCTFYPGGVPK